MMPHPPSRLPPQSPHSEPWLPGSIQVSVFLWKRFCSCLCCHVDISEEDQNQNPGGWSEAWFGRERNTVSQAKQD